MKSQSGSKYLQISFPGVVIVKLLQMLIFKTRFSCFGLSFFFLLFLLRQKLLHPPATDKYFFFIKKINRKSDSPVTFKSYKSGEYLHCKSDNGRVVMEKARGNKQPRDRETWFKLLPRRQQQQEQLIQIQQDQLDGMENTCESFLILKNDDPKPSADN